MCVDGIGRSPCFGLKLLRWLRVEALTKWSQVGWNVFHHLVDAHRLLAQETILDRIVVSVISEARGLVTVEHVPPYGASVPST